VCSIDIVEEVAHTARKSRYRCPDYKHSVGLWRGFDPCCATKRNRLSSQQSSSNTGSAETLGVYSAASTRFDCLQWWIDGVMWSWTHAVLHC